MRDHWVRLGGLLLLAALPATARGQEQRIAASEPAQLAPWAGRIQQMADAGQVRLTKSHEDLLVPGRRHQRFAQLHGGTPVYGGELVVQTGGQGLVSVFGTLYEGIDLDTRPTLSAEDVDRVARGQGGVPFGREGRPELMVLPVADGRYALTYKVRVRRPGFDLRLLFIDAKTGAIVEDRNDLKTESAVGIGTGVLGDKKKVSANKSGSEFLADDKLRPPRIATFDFKGDFNHLLSVPDFLDPDLAKDADNNWTDGDNVDAHTYAGYTYDFYYRRFGRQGLDNANIPIRGVTHPVNRDDIFGYPDSVIFQFYLNAFYAGDGIMVFGEGLPENLTFQGQSWNYLAGALDVVAHELTHGVTDFTSQLIYQNESGALNESFSDMMGTAAEFFFQPAGSGPLHADYLLGEDVVTPGGLRSMSNPEAFGDPDHYSRRLLGPQDNGFVHHNSGISNQAYYLAIEGGTNRVSGIRVTGVGLANRDHIEKVFYRAFTEMLPASANFSTARAATIQAARDLDGAGSATEAAVKQAWTAVGVN
jgi:Zn-dependent metalloprotease